MRRMLLIGIGAGNPDWVTREAIGALNAADVFFVVEKGSDADELAAVRREICARLIDGQSYRIVGVRDPPRDRAAMAYAAAVDDWRRARALLWERLIVTELGDDGVGAILVWGDPSLYDSTIAILDAIASGGRVALDVAVIPGVSAVAALCARHRIALNRVGESVLVTTGRRLERDGWPANAPDVVVLLDARCAFGGLRGRELDIYWGAYLGTPDELLVAGPLDEVCDEIVRVRAEARERKGWIMDAYLLRARPGRAPGQPRSASGSRSRAAE